MLPIRTLSLSCTMWLTVLRNYGLTSTALFRHCVLHNSHTRHIWISNFRRVLNVVCLLLGNSPACEFYMPTFRNTLSTPSSYAYEDGTDRQCSETSAYRIHTPVNYPEEGTQQDMSGLSDVAVFDFMKSCGIFWSALSLCFYTCSVGYVKSRSHPCWAPLITFLLVVSPSQPC